MRTPKFTVEELPVYPFRIKLRPGDRNVVMKTQIEPWLDENVKWSGTWTLEAEAGAPVGPDRLYYQFNVASIEDAMLVKLRWQ